MPVEPLPETPERTVPRVTLRKIAELGPGDGTIPWYEGVAYTPDGRFLLTSGFISPVTVYDAGSFEMVARGSVNVFAHGLGVASTGNVAVLGGRLSAIGFTVPGLEEVFQVGEDIPYALPAPSGSGFILAGAAATRIDATGEIIASFEPTDSGVALDRDGALFAVQTVDGVSQLVVLDPDLLTLRHRVTVPLRGDLVIPLERPGEVLVIQAGDSVSLAVVANFLTGELEGLQEIRGVLTHSVTGFRPFPGGNAWAAIADDLVLAPSPHGLLVIDLTTGRIGEPMRLASSFALPYVPCCAVAFDPLRGRVALGSRLEHQVIVYEVAVER